MSADNTYRSPMPSFALCAKYAAATYARAKVGLALQFDTEDEAISHLQKRQLAGHAGTFAGGLLGGALGRRAGVLGAVGGGLAGAYAGSAPGKLLADIAHDIPQRAQAQRHHALQQMESAGGAGVRIAAALPSIDEFVEFAQYDTSDAAPSDIPESGYDQTLAERLEPPRLKTTPVYDAASARESQVGITPFGGV